jgi:hypothetical protein
MQTFQVGLDSAVVDPFVLSISKKLAFNELAKEFPELVRSALIMSFLGLDGRYLVTILTVVLPWHGGVDLGGQTNQPQQHSQLHVRHHGQRRPHQADADAVLPEGTLRTIPVDEVWPPSADWRFLLAPWNWQLLAELDDLLEFFVITDLNKALIKYVLALCVTLDPR